MRARKFWEYVKRSQCSRRRVAEARGANGEKIIPGDLENYLTFVAEKKLYGKEEEQVSEAPVRLSKPSGLEITVEDVNRSLNRTRARTSTGMDGIPARIVKELTGTGTSYVTDLFNRILAGEEDIPRDWRNGKVVMLEKANSKPGDLTTYRPITVSTVLYRIFTKIIGLKIQSWMESNGILGEMQNGFRTDRRVDDNIFILTSAIELSRLDKTGLICVYLDCTAAYDTVNRRRLWEKLHAIGMNAGLIEVIQKIYTHNRATVEYNNVNSRWVKTDQGLRQGCPLSCILFMLYIWDVESELQKQGVGFRVKTQRWTWNTRRKIHFNMSGLLFADDLVLMARSYRDMEKLLVAMTKYGDENELLFNPDKSAVVVYSPHELGPHRGLSIQGRSIPEARDYKYLGITLSDSRNYLNKQEVTWERSATIALHQMHATTLWGFNRFEIARVQWKATAVPKLTYANAVLVMSKTLRQKLERSQRSAGKWALGIPGARVADEFIEGELGWSSFEARDAQSKLKYLERVRAMPDHRWPKALMTMIELSNQKTKLYQETEHLRAEYNCEDIRLQYDDTGRPLLGQFGKLIRKRILETQERFWKRNMQLKTSLQNYIKGKNTRGVPSYLYDNSRGSSLLALARANMLPTRARMTNSGEDKTCPRCGVYDETTEHVIFECNDVYYTEEELLCCLGLNSEANNATDVRRTKRILEDWDKHRSAETTRA